MFEIFHKQQLDVYCIRTFYGIAHVYIRLQQMEYH